MADSTTQEFAPGNTGVATGPSSPPPSPAIPPTGHRRFSRVTLGQYLIGATLTVITVIGLFPYLFMFATSFKSREQIRESYFTPTTPLTWSNYSRAWEQIRPYMETSFIVAAGCIALSLGVSVIAAAVLTRYKFPGRRAITALVLAMMMIPSVASIIPLFQLIRKFDLNDTYLGLILPMSAGGIIFGTVVISNYLRGIPQDLYDAAAVDGARGLRLFLWIIVPLAKPVIGTVALVNIISVWNEFFWPLLISSSPNRMTIPVGLQFFHGQSGTDWGPQFAGYVIASVPTLALFTLLSRKFLEGLQGGLSVSR